VSRAAKETREGEGPRAVLTVRGQNWGKARQRRGNHVATGLALQRHNQQAVGGQTQGKAGEPNGCH
jgi:hypothetical protein